MSPDANDPEGFPFCFLSPCITQQNDLELASSATRLSRLKHLQQGRYNKRIFIAGLMACIFDIEVRLEIQEMGSSRGNDSSETSEGITSVLVL